MNGMKREIHQLHAALLDLSGVLNRPQPDAALIAQAGIDLDRALFPLLVRVDRKGPLGIGELSELCGRDYTTVSRQVTKLESLGLILRQSNKLDGRVTEVVMTEKGRSMTHALDRARVQLMTAMLAHWSKQDVAELAQLLRRLADDALHFGRRAKSRSKDDGK
jgi:DNA-binding MarR family transcriptional regulator